MERNTADFYERTKLVDFNEDIAQSMLGDAQYFREHLLPLFKRGQSKDTDNPWRELAGKAGELENLAILENKYYEPLLKGDLLTQEERDLLVKIPSILNVIVSDLDNMEKILMDRKKYMLKSVKDDAASLIRHWDAWEQLLGHATNMYLERYGDRTARQEAAS